MRSTRRCSLLGRLVSCWTRSGKGFVGQWAVPLGVAGWQKTFAARNELLRATSNSLARPQTQTRSRSLAFDKRIFVSAFRRSRNRGGHDINCHDCRDTFEMPSDFS